MLKDAPPLDTECCGIWAMAAGAGNITEASSEQMRAASDVHEWDPHPRTALGIADQGEQTVNC